MRYRPEDKFVLEIRDTVGRLGDGDIYYEARNYSPVISENELNQLDRLDSDYINEHYGDLQDSTYQQGMNDAWEIAKKLYLSKKNGGLSDAEIEEIFGQLTTCEIFLRYTPQEIKAKIEAWEKAKAEIKVGDVVRYSKGDNREFVVTSTKDNSEDKWCTLLSPKGEMEMLMKENLTKTGRTIDIASVLEQIGGTA